MNNGLKALLIAASTIITCMIVTLGFSLAKEAKQIGNQVTEELERYKTTLSERELMKYDGTEVFGADIVNLIKTELTHTKTEFMVSVIAAGETFSFSTAEEYEKRGRECARVLKLTERYRGSVIRNKNDVITELQFIKMEES